MKEVCPADDPYALDASAKYKNIVTRVNNSKDSLREGKKLVQFRDMDGEDWTFELNSRFMYGMLRARVGLYREMLGEGHGDLAMEIMTRVVVDKRKLG